MQRMHARNLYIGTTAERTALAALLPTDGIGAVYYDTDTGIMYYWDGATWSTDYQDLTPYLKKVEDLVSDVRLGGSTDANMLYLNVSSNRIGIGTNAPTGRLEVVGLPENDLPSYSAEFLDADDWTSTDWTGDWASGFDHTTGNTTPLSQAHAAVIGTKYQIAYTVTGRTAGSFTISFGGQSLAGITATGAFGPTATTTDNLVITPLSTFDGTIVISIKSITAEEVALLMLKNSSGTEVSAIRSGLLTNNVYIGRAVGAWNTTGQGNTGVGTGALYLNTTGNYNVGIGNRALYYNTVGYRNVGIGAYSLENNLEGYENLGLGNSTLSQNRKGSRNVGIGAYALNLNRNGNFNIAIGGYTPLYNAVGSYNIGIGYQVMQSLVIGAYNTSIGVQSLYNLSATGKAISAFSDYGGTVAGTVKATSTGHGLSAGTTSNIAIANTEYYDGVYTVTYIDANNFYFTATWVATSTGFWGKNAEASSNVAIGLNSGRTITTGSSNTFIGYYAGYNASQLATASNCICLGANSYATASNQCVLGNSSITSTLLFGNIGIGITPTTILHISSNSAPTLETTSTTGWTVASYMDGVGGGGQYVFSRYGGTKASPTGVLVGMTLGSLSFRGYNTSTLTGSKAFIQARAAENWSTTANGTKIIFSTTPTGSTTLAVALTIEDSGSLTLCDGGNLILGTTTGTKIGTATTQKLGFWNATPIVQPLGATQVAPAAYVTGNYGLDSDANMLALYDLVVAMRTVLVNTGLMKGSA